MTGVRSCFYVIDVDILSSRIEFTGESFVHEDAPRTHAPFRADELVMGRFSDFMLRRQEEVGERVSLELSQRAGRVRATMRSRLIEKESFWKVVLRLCWSPSFCCLIGKFGAALVSLSVNFAQQMLS